MDRVTRMLAGAMLVVAVVATVQSLVVAALIGSMLQLSQAVVAIPAAFYAREVLNRHRVSGRSSFRQVASGCW